MQNNLHWREIKKEEKGQNQKSTDTIKVLCHAESNSNLNSIRTTSHRIFVAATTNDELQDARIRLHVHIHCVTLPPNLQPIFYGYKSRKPPKTCPWPPPLRPSLFCCSLSKLIRMKQPGVDAYHFILVFFYQEAIPFLKQFSSFL